MKKNLDFILNRTSVRNYSNKNINNKDIDLILRCAMSSATAKNSQPWKFFVVKDREILNKLGNSFKYYKMLLEAPLAIVVCGDRTKFLEDEYKDFWIQDCSSATTSILLGAKALGIGSCWLGVYSVKEIEEMIKKILKIKDENIIPFSIVSLGYPSKPCVIKDKYKKENIIYKGD